MQGQGQTQDHIFSCKTMTKRKTDYASPRPIPVVQDEDHSWSHPFKIKTKIKAGVLKENDRLTNYYGCLLAACNAGSGYARGLMKIENNLELRLGFA